jgi:hypothetical protein
MELNDLATPREPPSVKSEYKDVNSVRSVCDSFIARNSALATFLRSEGFPRAITASPNEAKSDRVPPIANTPSFNERVKGSDNIAGTISVWWESLLFERSDWLVGGYGCLLFIG